MANTSSQVGNIHAILEKSCKEIKCWWSEYVVGKQLPDSLYGKKGIVSGFFKKIIANQWKRWSFPLFTPRKWVDYVD